jgi:glycosyltransferase involved in cell wall biosynthesis
LNVQYAEVPIRVVPPLTKPSGNSGVVDRLYREDSHLHIGMVARHGRGKGTEALLRAWQQLNNQSATLHLWGPVAERGLRALVDRLASERADLEVHGPFDREELSRILDGLDIGLMLSVEEGYGLVVCEYMSVGLPFIMTDVGASSEFTADNPDALLLRVSESAVAEGLLEMMSRVRAGQTSRTRLRRRYDQRHAPELFESAHLELVERPDLFWSK